MKLWKNLIRKTTAVEHKHKLPKTRQDRKKRKSVLQGTSACRKTLVGICNSRAETGQECRLAAWVFRRLARICILKVLGSVELSR